jgi:hypothetical protein
VVEHDNELGDMLLYHCINYRVEADNVSAVYTARVKSARVAKCSADNVSEFPIKCLKSM